MSDINKQTLIQFIETVWNQGNADAVAQFLADSYTIYHDPGDPWHQQTLSVAGFKERLSHSRAPFPDQQFHIQHLVAEGNHVSMAWLWSGTHLAPLGEFAPSGQTIEMSGVTHYMFENGRIAGHWQVSDRLAVYQQLMRNQG